MILMMDQAQMIYEVLDNSIDEALAGYCNKIDVILNVDGTVTISDNGRGIPVDLHKTEKIPAAQLIMTELRAVNLIKIAIKFQVVYMEWAYQLLTLSQKFLFWK